MLRLLFERRIYDPQILDCHRSVGVFLTYMQNAALNDSSLSYFTMCRKYDAIFVKTIGCAYSARSCIHLRPMRPSRAALKDGLKPATANRLKLTSELLSPYVHR